MKTCLSVVLTFVLAATPLAAVERGCFTGRCRVRVQPSVVINPSVFPQLQPYQYQVGSQLREEALAELIAQKVVQKLQGKAASQQAGQPKIDAQGSERLAGAQSVVNSRCVSCHNPNKPDRVDFSDLSKVAKGVETEIFKRAYAGTMPPPPGADLSDEEVYQLMRWMVYRQ